LTKKLDGEKIKSVKQMSEEADPPEEIPEEDEEIKDWLKEIEEDEEIEDWLEEIMIRAEEEAEEASTRY
jgi:ABC-type nitrate/sulfonate/bicarbonate transport system substrate-binding protein